ncbi:iron uptake system protein EfeO [Pseudarthrobacter sp. So.54]
MTALRTSPRRFPARLGIAATAALLPFTLAACTDNAAPAASTDAAAITVSSTNGACAISATEAPSGNLTFAIKNDGDRVTEFYLLAEDGLRILAEVENIGPGITRNLVATVPAGKYLTACKPGMEGDGLRAAFTVTGSNQSVTVDDDVQKLTDTAAAQYTAYVKDQTEQLLAGTRSFAEAFATGDSTSARGLYASTRMHWERIEPVAESFGDLDPKLDLREADLESGEAWTGWHRAEKDLFAPAGYTAMTSAERAALSTQLVADTEDLYQRTRTLTLTADKLGNGAKELLDEVATGKVTGEEEIWSHTDLWDFQANVDGARIAFESLSPALEKKDPALAVELETKFSALQTELTTHARGEQFALYNELTPEQVRTLAALVDTLGEPLSRLTAAVVL